MPNTTTAPVVHHLRATYNGLDSLGYVWQLTRGDGTTTDYFSAGSASGPVAPIYQDMGVLTPGTELALPYNYATNQYANKTGGWHVVVKRVNQKSVTVVDADGKPYRVEL